MRESTEAAFGGPLTWEEMPGRRTCRIADYGQGDAANVKDHDAHIDWFFDSLERLRNAVDGVKATVAAR
jgi:hypothetical protein